MNLHLSRRRFVGAAAATVAAPLVHAQAAWPTAKPIALTVGLQAGTGSDVAARNLAEKVSAAIGQQIVVNAVPGAAGLLAAQQGAKAAPDGYSLVALSGAAVTTLPHLQKGDNPARNLVPIAMVVSFPSVISVNAKVPAQNIREFIELVKKNPGKYTYASGGNGSVQHTAMEQLKAMAGLNLLHVPYKGMAQATTDLVGGQVDSAIQGVVAVIPFAKTGQVRPLAWTGQRRNPLYPDLPTLHEAGVTGYNFQSWTALFGPAGLPRDIVTRLNAEFRKAAAAPDLKARWAEQAMEYLDMSPEQIADLVKLESDQMARLVRDVGIKMD
ncbi:MAG TPA: tripartite tricarboxylate transporter substrate binding protein [Ramlibacter sp.]|nr:tripartite tricarboxylate transporter substrate binding protein [Ramlibacter sp.]